MADITDMDSCQSEESKKSRPTIRETSQSSLITNLTHFFQCIFLFHFSTYFEQPSVHHQQNRIVLIHHLVYITLCRWLSGMPTGIPGSHLHRMTYTRWCIDTIRFCWWWALGCSKYVQKWNK